MQFKKASFLLLSIFFVIACSNSEKENTEQQIAAQQNTASSEGKGVKPHYVDWNGIEKGTTTASKQGIRPCNETHHRAPCTEQAEVAVKNAYFNYADVPNTNEVPHYNKTIQTNDYKNEDEVKNQKQIEAAEDNAEPNGQQESIDNAENELNRDARSLDSASKDNADNQSTENNANTELANIPETKSSELSEGTQKK